MNPLLIAAIVIVGIANLLFILQMEDELEKNGIGMNILFVLPMDFLAYYRIIKKEKDRNTRIWKRIIFWIITIINLFLTLGVIIFLIIMIWINQ